MTDREKASNANRAGNWLGTLWKSYLRIEKNFSIWLCQIGAPPLLARTLGWCTHALVIGFLLFIMSWIALLLVIVAIGSFGIYSSRGYNHSYDSEWRDGPLGFGLYDQNGARLDPYDPDEM
ncbi:DUF3742 family protein [Pseudomonas sp. lyk4-40-TSB-59a]|uniref:DUF3742 family protein n=1 Tax=Pseudomonas sp. lyk4-40-TSB-59a TaxID=3040314 RepID=UPI0033075FD7